MSAETWVRFFTISILPVALLVGACASTSEDGWSPTVENLYSYSGDIPDGFQGESPEVEILVKVQVQRIRRGLSDRSKYVLAQESNPPQPCRDQAFTWRFLDPAEGGVIQEGTATTDEAGRLRIKLPVKVREQGSRGLGADLLVQAVLAIGRSEGRLYRTSDLSVPRVRFGGGFLVAVPAKFLSDQWLRYGDREL